MNPISLIAVVHNEQERIGAFIKQVAPIVSQIVLVDQSSTDETKTRAGRAWIESSPRATMVWVDEPCRGFSEASNPLALSKCTQPWVLVLFPDETLTNDFVVALPQLCADPRMDGYRFFRDTYLDGRPLIMHEQTVRLVRREHIRLLPRIHTDPICMSDRVRLPEWLAIDHRKTEVEQHADNLRYMAIANGEGVL